MNTESRPAMKIVVAGATGTLGSHVVDAVRAAGHEPVPLSRASGTDLMTGSGLTEALRGASAVIDASATGSTSTKGSVSFFTTVTRNLLAAEREAGVPHHVAISIIGAAKVAANYYAGKAAQEEILTTSCGGGWSLLRTTQFHEFAKQLVGHGKAGPLQVVPKMRAQPVAAAEVAAELVAIAAGDPRGIEPDLAGPREERMSDLVRRFLAATGQRRPVVEVPLPGAWGRGMRDGSLLPGPGTRLGRQTFDAWLTGQAG
ncbi:SDR family oxidoreductase [Streptomyces sp. NBC_01012]|uniref:SDR family oxidoreductase n=1 Tax=Streptomyces sp. NBC_01012 TaxID=2903717 RepID=UPI003870414D|nr:SDR family oxidoreductase [Streptomyces sp. NBC_01012]